MTEEDLRLLFSNTGGTVKAFKFFQYVYQPDLKHCQGFFLFFFTPLHCLTAALWFPGTVKWLWSRCPQWRRPPRPWSIFTTTTWEATSTSESPSPSRPFENQPCGHLTVSGFPVEHTWDCLDTGEGVAHRSDQNVFRLLLILSFLERL